ncbi:PREDICTED: nuclear cap-binding protein subunit 2-like [Cercocebus atys]|uniref:nuclear cap-binding protein subunit 2-like n=1 Tax=Cercocebus atys TaxID=9531 RepID=UPI0005F52FA0|nr:PREDICTED: nuclear cap-binding protein subunit 2-like [Cercocebus atys]
MSKGLKILCKDPVLELSCCRDHQFSGSKFQQEKLLKESSTMNMRNLSFYTTEEKIHELFSRSDIRNIFMGLDKIKKTACGFCFVECHKRADAENAMQFLNGTCLDEWIIRTDWDIGFREGQQYGRGKSGSQVRDEFREDFHSGRGGFGRQSQI